MSGALNRTATEKRRRRDTLMIEQGGLCHYCQCKLTIGPARPKDSRATDATFDHVIPRSERLPGLNHKWNVVLACRQCNADKGSMPADEFRAALPVLIERRLCA